MSSITIYIHVRTTPDEPTPYVVGCWAIRYGEMFHRSDLRQIDEAGSHAQGCLHELESLLTQFPIITKMVVDVVIPDRAVVAMLAPDASAPRSRTTQRIVRRVRALLSEKTPNARLRAGRIYEMETIATDDDLWA